MKPFILTMATVILLSPTISFAAASADDGDSGKKSKDGNSDVIHFDELPQSKHPGLDDLLDKARERLAKKTESDDLRKKLLKTEAERKRKIEERLERFLGTDLPDEVPDSHRPGILEDENPKSRVTKTEQRKSSRFIPISTEEIKTAFSNVMSASKVDLQRDGNDLIVDVLCSRKNEDVLEAALPEGKTTPDHIDDVRNRYCAK
ncbi:hypothetical protein [Sulfitobacter sp. R18_1]|uniref:hypothetical protein n=1 Tax=Sulfitobacter sp. R18_1 TaxID=2821104 RepID=UPI001ADA75DF|nr:hypothetical protein [Sulfitobacter sp. R18_1]MBO9428466.1 hypothetical protein [Sulfitobacter sp. R18_1]